MELRFRLLPLDTRVFNPEVGVTTLPPIGHSVGVEELDSKIKTAHLAIFLEVPDELVLQTLRVTLLQRTRRIVGARRSRILHNIDRSVTKRNVAPITQLLIRFDFLVRLNLHQGDGP